MDIRTACARVGGSNSGAQKFGDLSEEVVAALLAREAAEVAKIAGVTKHEVQYESIGASRPDGQQQLGREGPSLAELAPKYIKNEEHRHWYTIGQSSSYYAAMVGEQHGIKQSQQPPAAKDPTPAMLLQRVLMQQAHTLQALQPGSARSSSSSTSTHKPAMEQGDC